MISVLKNLLCFLCSLASLVLGTEQEVMQSEKAAGDELLTEDCSEYYETNITQLFGFVNYSYADMPSKCVFPVQEYVDEDDEKPNFLFSADGIGARSVLFYKPTCPYSQALKPVYIRFARAISKHIPPAAEPPTFYAISCDAHGGICNSDEYNVTAVPHISLYGPNSLEETFHSHSVNTNLKGASTTKEEIEAKAAEKGITIPESYKEKLDPDYMFAKAVKNSLEDFDLPTSISALAPRAIAPETSAPETSGAEGSGKPSHSHPSSSLFPFLIALCLPLAFAAFVYWWYHQKERHNKASYKGIELIDHDAPFPRRSS